MTNGEHGHDEALRTSGDGGAVERTHQARLYAPPADILETEAGYELTLDLPGVEPDSLDVTYENDVLTLRAKTRRPQPEGYALAHAEFELGDYQRAFEVTEHVDADGIEASLRHGVLTIRLPKTKPTAHKVSVSTT